jgi:thioredoxin reductase
MSEPRKSIAILGAGPIGVEAALYALELGHQVQVYERGSVGENVRRWGHLRLFSSWEINRSVLGVRELAARGVALAADQHYPTGAEYCESYLDPLARSPRLADRIHEHCSVRHVGRDRIAKLDLVGGPRERHPFRILVDSPTGESVVRADTVIDCTGTYGQSNWMGNGNIPAVGERGARERIAYTSQDITGAHRERYAGRRVLLVGAGHSAATALELLTDLEGTTVVWVVRSERAEPLKTFVDDPLPERDRLSRLANRIAREGHAAVEVHGGTVVEALQHGTSGFEITLSKNGVSRRVCVDRILAHVGYEPDNSIYRELQVHECYASLGPMKLASTLLASDSADCLALSSAGPESLRNPEPGFFILGAKSYGKNSNFLMRVGLQQIREVFSLIENRPDLNLYAAPLRAGVMTQES